MSTELPPSDSLFAIGEVAIYWRPGATGHGMEVTIAGLEYRRDGVDCITGTPLRADMFYVLANPSPINGVRWLVTERVLRKKRPPVYLTTWGQCVWQPETIHV